MFGYIKPDKENLYVKELNLYKSVYCGLCETIKKKISFFLPLSLSYDFVFLTMLRATLIKEKSTLRKGKCKYNPLKKVNYCIPEEASLYTARCALILTTLNIKDDLKDSDTSILKKAYLLPLYMHLNSKVKKLLKNHSEYMTILQHSQEKLAEISLLEKEKSTDIDRICTLFGDIMGVILAFSLEGSKKIIASEFGSSIGKYIYLIDAIDDAERDQKNKVYNPLIKKYGSYVKIKERAKELDCVLSMHIQNAVLSFNLIDKWDFDGIINNILTLGLGKENYKIFNKNGE